MAFMLCSASEDQSMPESRPDVTRQGVSAIDPGAPSRKARTSPNASRGSTPDREAGAVSGTDALRCATRGRTVSGGAGKAGPATRFSRDPCAGLARGDGPGRGGIAKATARCAVGGEGEHDGDGDGNGAWRAPKGRYACGGAMASGGAGRPLLWHVERHLKDSGVAATSFGRRAVRDPRLVFDLRRGREPGAALAARVLAFIAASRETRGKDA